MKVKKPGQKAMRKLPNKKLKFSPRARKSIDPAESVFPLIKQVGDLAISTGGLSLRDWFAGMALGKIEPHSYPEDIARTAYATADAMIIRRKNRG